MRRLVVVDGKNQAIRHYFGAENKKTGALEGLARVLESLLFEDYYTYIAVALDPETDTWRHELYPAYKETRPNRPEELEDQIPWLSKIAECFNVRALCYSRYEADDVIGSLVVKAKALGYKSYIISSDKDLMQLVDYTTQMMEVGKPSVGPREVFRKFGVHPHQLVDYLALVGDPVDNVPGVKGIGPRAATELLKDGRTIKSALELCEDPKLLARLERGLDEARLSYRLVRLKTKVAVPDLVDLRRPDVVWSECTDRVKEVLRRFKRATS